MKKKNIIEGHISEFISHIGSNDGTIYYQKFGINYFDNVLNGIMPGEVLTFLGDTGSGRTGCAVRMIDYLAIDHRIPILYFCCNYAVENILCRLLSFSYSLSFKPTLKELRKANCESIIDDGLNELTKIPLFISTASHYSIDDIEEKCKKFVEQEQVRIIFVHMLYLDNNIENAQKLKILAKNLNVSIIVFDDVFEYREGIDGVKPSLRDLYYDRLNEYSDIVIGLCNYSSYNIYQDDRGIDLHDLVGIEILKGRKKEDLVSFYIPQKSLYKKL